MNKVVKAPPKPNPLPMTEQEYIQTCNTEQLAEELLMATMSDVLYAKIIPCKTHEDAIRVVREWLKQPHTNE